MKLSERFAIKITKYIKNTLPDKNEDDLAIIKYGVELLFMSFNKIPIILCVSYLMGMFKETCFTMLVFGIIRSSASGIHAKTSSTCLISTLVAILGGIYISRVMKINILVKILIFIVSFIIYLKYSPADTEEKPYVNSQIRKKLKVRSLITITIYFIISIVIKNKFFSNMFINILWIQGILIVPITYKIFNRRYNNYEYYEKEIF
ncbi:accessory gene regulator B family protein [Clostridium botulinum]|uniref:Accessory gene regulator AgrB n=1 Tax=Clostridium botulinum C/D str. DC5 TaxID=1443128 RepID=A0A0A0IC99_CLOBO|nr:accessory gene regulator B family protein [Clostridium botulinum]KGM97250.1 accessory gene regulator AgrB [Clostridium botulinum D str. CCUG 7971]KGM99079.1 accessory gene regulator AgrB [Clostridium botulinum C/D str. DC5]KOC45897.1 accessory regulator AgrB [Clostridium botulinum]KOC54457.1 accessory regulator AgrB [Clostridium botulinum]KOC58466.1 accessory regulator AgrB [Clostridium botulinum]